MKINKIKLNDHITDRHSALRQQKTVKNIIHLLNNYDSKQWRIFAKIKVS